MHQAVSRSPCDELTDIQCNGCFVAFSRPYKVGLLARYNGIRWEPTSAAKEEHGLPALHLDFNAIPQNSSSSSSSSSAIRRNELFHPARHGWTNTGPQVGSGRSLICL